MALAGASAGEGRTVEPVRPLSEKGQTIAKAERVDSGPGIKDNVGEGTSGAGKLKDIPQLTPEDIPTAKSGKFNKFFNSLSVEELDEIWKNKALRKKIERQLRAPGGLHEWHLVSRAPL
ncbi:hypothetical protein QS257_04015 [Terrilactibacillus sp. S3-3]|nr:hypothetical protein QS257_04015 [Terrilactibacillus sp. S3-3]